MTEGKLIKYVLSLSIIFMLVTAGFAGLLIFAGLFDKAGVDAATTRYVGSDQAYKTIGAAITAAGTGDTIRVYAGTYYENVNVNKKVIMIGNGTTKTIIDGGLSGDVVYVTADGVEISDVLIRNSGTFAGCSGIGLDGADNCLIESCELISNTEGILLNNSDHNRISNNTIKNNFWGILIYGGSDYNTVITNIMNNSYYDIYSGLSTHNVFESNTCTSIGVYNIALHASTFSEVIGNTCTNSYYNLQDFNSANNTFKNNSCGFSRDYALNIRDSRNGTYLNNEMDVSGIFIEGTILEHWNTHEIDMNNTLAGKPVYYFKNTDNVTVPVNAGQVIVVNCSDIVVKNLKMSKGAGIMAGFVDNITIENNENDNGTFGISVFEMVNSTINNNSCDSNTQFDIAIKGSNFNSITNNTCKNSYNGMRLWFCDNNYVANNTCEALSQHSMRLITSSNNTIENNTLFSTGREALQLLKHYYSKNGSDNNTIKSNKCTSSRPAISIEQSSNNTVINNSFPGNTGSAILLEEATYNKVLENKCSGNGSVALRESNNNLIISNECNNNYYGIEVRDSKDNNIFDNDCSNGTIGIYMIYTTGNNIGNNTMYNCSSQAIVISSSTNENLFGNKMIGCGVTISGVWREEWTSHTIPTTNKVNGKPLYYIKNQVGGQVISGGGQIILANCTGVLVKDHDVSNQSIGILLGFSSKNLVINNTCDNQNIYGIDIHYSWNNRIENNSCDHNNYQGIYAISASSNLLSNNSCSYNFRHGIYMDWRSSGTVHNNACSFNEVGIYLSANEFNLTNNICNYNDKEGIYPGAQVIIFDNNTCNHNNWSGINYATARDSFKNNTCSYNGWNGILASSMIKDIEDSQCNNNGLDGIRRGYGDPINISNTTCNGNGLSGIRLSMVDDNRLVNNTCLTNAHAGIDVMMSNNNLIKSNNCSFNKFGIVINRSSDNNEVSENDVTYNSDTGIVVERWIDNTVLYYNNIIKNKVQASDQSSSTWHNTDLEGNYWSDYSGKDDGSGTGKHAVVGDGIGDTNVPHRGLDDYPFVTPSGWVLRDVPILSGPKVVVMDGDYTLVWTPAWRADLYYLEEDTSLTFNSPKEYVVNDRSFGFYDVPDGIYYYRVRGYNNNTLSYMPWSNIIDVTVDLAPLPPGNLNVSAVSEHEVELSWDPVNDTDILGYFILMNSTGGNSAGPFDHLGTVTGSINTYTAAGLTGEITYHFVVVAFDKYSNSSYSNVLKVTTPDQTPPSAPVWISGKAVSDTQIDLVWKYNPEADIMGYQVFMNETGHGPSGEFKLIKSTPFTDTACMILGLSEQTTYHFKLRAYDEVPNHSPFSTVMSITTPDLTPPDRPTGLEVIHATTSTLTLTWDMNTADDVVNYTILRSQSISERFVEVAKVDANSSLANGSMHQFIDTDLADDTTYYYMINATDDAGLTSSLSDIAFGKTLLGQRKPELHIIIASVLINEDSYDDHTVDLSRWFYDPNNDTLTYRCEGNEKIKVTIDQGTGKVRLEPEKNWNGDEVLTFYAHDGFTDEVPNSVTVTVTPVPDAPDNASILQPPEGAVFKKGFQIIFRGVCNDADLPYGDNLTFEWSSHKIGIFGEGKELLYDGLPEGNHLIALMVTDSYGLKDSCIMNITIMGSDDIEKIDDEEEESNASMVILGVGGIIFIVIVILIWLLFFRRKPEETSETEEGDGVDRPDEIQESPGVQVPPVEAPVQEPVDYPQQVEQQYYEQPQYPEQMQPEVPVGQPVEQQPPPGEAENIKQETLPPTVESKDVSPETSVEGAGIVSDEAVQPEPPIESPPPTAHRSPSTDQQQPLRLVPCPTCGNQIPANTTPCPHCSTMLNWDS